MLRQLSFRGRLTLRGSVLVALLLGATFVAVYAGARTFASRELDAQVRTLAATELASAIDGGTVHLHALPIDSLGGGTFAAKFTQLYAPDGVLLAQSPGLEGTGFRLPAAVLAAGLRGEAPLLSLQVGARPARIAVLEAPGDSQAYIVAAGLFTDELQAALGRLAWLLLGIWVGAVLLGAAVAAAFASRTLARINAVTQRASAIARGDFAARLDRPSADDEIGRMTTLLNEVLDRLHGAVEANRRFAADASHELRSPLTAMAGEIDVALKRDRPALEYRETLEVLRARLRELAGLADDLMLLTRLQERPRDAVLKEVAIAPLIEETASRLRRASRARSVTLRFDAFPDLSVYGDGALLGRVFDNLLANAVQYNREGGEVVLRGRVEDPAPDAWEAGVAIVTVSDTGPGIPAAEWERVFERFHRLDLSRSRRTGGTGLGLAICRAIVTVFGGTIGIVASGEGGTTFEVRLPGRAGPGTRLTAPVVPEAHTTRPRSTAPALTTAERPTPQSR